jgi:hypothetical protein
MKKSRGIKQKKKKKCNQELNKTKLNNDKCKNMHCAGCYAITKKDE